MKEIPVVYTPETQSHTPQFEVHEGRRYPSFDSVNRYQAILDALKICGFADLQIVDVDAMPEILKVHDAEYIQFLEHVSRHLGEYVTDDEVEPGVIRAYYPSVFPYSQLIDRLKVAGEGKIGLHAFDTYTPILESTFDDAVASAGVAAAGAMLLRRGLPLVYALTRPPGHHAERSGMMGYCYINNAAVASEYLISQGSQRVAIFDIDLHHGNGIQSYGYHRQDVLYVSIHGHPHVCYPYLTGFEDERGKDLGYGTNFNFPLPRGTDNQVYLSTTRKALREIYSYSPEYLIIAAGFDTHEKDPFATFRLSSNFYTTLGRKIANLNLPTLIVQEGGYNLNILGPSVVSFLAGFKK